MPTVQTNLRFWFENATHAIKWLKYLTEMEGESVRVVIMRDEDVASNSTFKLLGPVGLLTIDDNNDFEVQIYEEREE